MRIKRIEQESIHHSNAIKDESIGKINKIGDTAIMVDAPDYSGPYEVRSVANASKTLQTKGHLMKDDVTVLAISYWETSNDDGTTVYIGVD